MWREENVAAAPAAAPAAAAAPTAAKAPAAAEPAVSRPGGEREKKKKEIVYIPRCDLLL